MKTAYRVVVGVACAVLALSLMYYFLPSPAYPSVFLASAVAGGIFSPRIRRSSPFAMVFIFSLTAIGALLYWQRFFMYYPLAMVPFRSTVSPYVASSGSSQEIFTMVFFIILSLTGGAVGGLADSGVLSLIEGAKTAEPVVAETEISRLSKKLLILTKEKEKLEEELRICDMIEQGSKTRIAKNEITQSDYDSIIYRNDSYRMKLKARMEKVNSEIQQLKVDIEARQKASEHSGTAGGTAGSG